MKTANEILFEHGINTMSLNDDFNSQLFHAMERYAEQFSQPTLILQGESKTILKEIADKKYPQLEGADIVYNNTQKEKQVMFLEGMEYAVSHPELFKTKEEGITGEDTFENNLRITEIGTERGYHGRERFIFEDGIRIGLNLKLKKEGEDIRKEYLIMKDGVDLLGNSLNSLHANIHKMALPDIKPAIKKIIKTCEMVQNGTNIPHSSTLQSLSTLPSTAENNEEDLQRIYEEYDHRPESLQHFVTYLSERYFIYQKRKEGIDKEEEMINISLLKAWVYNNLDEIETQSGINGTIIWIEELEKFLSQPKEEKDNTVTENKSCIASNIPYPSEQTVDYEAEARKLYWTADENNISLVAYSQRQAHIRARQMSQATIAELTDKLKEWVLFAAKWENGMSVDRITVGDVWEAAIKRVNWLLSSDLNNPPPDKATFLSSIPLGGDVKQKCIAFGEWIEDSDYLELVDNNWYHKDDKDGDQPFTTEQLYEQYLTSLDTKK